LLVRIVPSPSVVGDPAGSLFTRGSAAQESGGRPLNDTALPNGGAPGRDQCGEIQFLDVEKPTCKFVKFKLSCK